MTVVECWKCLEFVSVANKGNIIICIYMIYELININVVGPNEINSFIHSHVIHNQDILTYLLISDISCPH